MGVALQPMRVLVTNDDGIGAEGIERLARAVAERGHEVVVVAPNTNMSGMSAALGAIDVSETIDVRSSPIDDLEGYAVAAPPALGVLAATQGAFGPPPDLVACGINAGLNTGHSVLHSGTVGAAMTAVMLGIPAMAISLAAADRWHHDTAQVIAGLGIDWMSAHPRSGAVLNLNVPGLALDQMRGLQWASLDRFGAVQARSGDPASGLQFELRAPESETVPGSDTALVREGFATATLIWPVSSVDAPAFPSFRYPTAVRTHLHPAPVESIPSEGSSARQKRPVLPGR